MYCIYCKQFILFIAYCVYTYHLHFYIVIYILSLLYKIMILVLKFLSVHNNFKPCSFYFIYIYNSLQLRALVDRNSRHNRIRKYLQVCSPLYDPRSRKQICVCKTSRDFAVLNATLI